MLPTDAVNFGYVSGASNVFTEKIAKLEKEIESMKNLPVDAKKKHVFERFCDDEFFEVKN